MPNHTTTEPLVLALLKRLSDEARLLQQQTYHIPIRQSKHLLGASHIAWYVPSWHPQTPWSLRYQATIYSANLMTRAAYIPEESLHPRAAERYWVIAVTDLHLLDPVIASTHWRRVSVHRVDANVLARTNELGQLGSIARRMPTAAQQWEW